MATAKNLLFSCIIILLLVACDTPVTKGDAIVKYVAQDAIAVLKISNLSTLEQELESNPLATHFKNNIGYMAFNDDPSFLKHVTPNGITVISVSQRNDSVFDYALATRETASVFELDSIPNKQIETLTYDGVSIQRVSLDNLQFFTAVKDSVFMASTSQLQLQQLLKNEPATNKELDKALSVLKNNDFTSVVKNPSHLFAEGNEHTLATYQSLDMVLTPNGAIASGVALAQDTLPELLAVFKGQIPQQNDLEKVLPKNATQAISFTISDASLFVDRLGEYNGTPISEAPLELLSGTNEIGEIMLTQGNAVVLKSIDAAVTEEALAPLLSESTVYREVQLYTFGKPALFQESLAPFIQTNAASVAFQLDPFFVFAENTEVAEGIISAYKNNACLHKEMAFEKSATYISNASSLLLYGMNSGVSQLLQQLERSANHATQGTINETDMSLALLQYSFDRDFAHVHFVCLESNDVPALAGGGVSEVFSKALPTKVLGTTQFFNDYRTGRKNIVVQDISNTLHLLTDTGKTAWTKSLEGPIMGAVHEIDILRNGRKQITFVTKNKWYVLDRNGKDVSGFPVTFKDDITQPLAVFDYDNNRKYRFVIVQGKDVLMYNSEAKTVKGFTFKKATSNIVLSPEHIRMGNKDYIVIAEDNGKLNILSRTGKTRVPVADRFKFSENSIEREQSNFVVITSDNQKKSIDTKGTVTTTALDVSSTYYFVTQGSTKVTLDDNLLRINGKLTELPFGMYTAPKIFTANRNTYITITELQEKKVYVLRKDGTIVNGFPVFGSSAASLSATNKQILLTVIGQDNEVVLFKL